MRNPLTRNLGYLSLVALFFLPVYTTALESDKDQPLMWSADGDSRMSLRGEFRILVMSNNVRVTQGTLQINGDEVIIETRINSDEPPKITVHGSPVRYQQQLDNEGGLVVGFGDTLMLYTDEVNGEEVLELIGNAAIQSPDASLKCSAITYIADRDLIREAAGPCEGVLSSTTN